MNNIRKLLPAGSGRRGLFLLCCLLALMLTALVLAIFNYLP